MGLAVDTVRSVADVPVADWADLAAGSLYGSYRWQAFVETDTGAECHYVTVRRDGRLVAGLALSRVIREDNEFYDPQRLVDGRWQGGYLVAGTRRGYVNPVPVSAALPEPERRDVLDALLRAVEERSAAEAGDGALFLYVPGGTAAELQAVRPDLLPLLTSMDAYLPLPGGSLDDYLTSLRKQARTNARREIATYRGSGLATGFERLSACYEEAAPLLRQLQERYGHGGSAEHYRDMLARHAELLDDLSLVVTARRSGRLVAFALFYLWADTMHLRLAGFDYTGLADAFEYFNVAFYLPIEWAYGNGYRLLHLGRESFDAKLRRGARLRPMLSAALPAGGPGDRASALDWNQRQLREWRAGAAGAHVTGAEWDRWTR